MNIGISVQISDTILNVAPVIASEGGGEEGGATWETITTTWATETATWETV